MPNSYAPRVGQEGVRYRIVIRGALGEPLVGPLEGMTIEADGEESVVTGVVVDQAHLRGILAWLADLGVELVSFNPMVAGR